MVTFREPTTDRALLDVAQHLHHAWNVFTDGHTMIWEYPRATPTGDQMDFTEVMELGNGLIRHHRVYWGWLGVRTLTTESHGR